MPIRVEQSPKRVHAYLAGVAVADSEAVMLVWEGPHYPIYYFPSADVRLDLLEDTGATHHSTSRGDARLYNVTVGDRTAPEAAARYLESPMEELRDLVRFEWAALDEWLEEDEPVYTHPRSPYTRIDILGSSRHVTVTLDGVVIAESRQPRVLFETGLPPRYYLPIADVRLDLFTPSATITHCPYKGDASYLSATVNGTFSNDVAWMYRSPLPESQKIAGLVCFYDDRTTVTVASD